MPRPHDPIDAFLPDLALLEASLEPIAVEHIREALRMGIQLAIAEAVGETGNPLRVDNPLVQGFLQQYVGLLSNRVNRTLVDNVRAALIDGLDAGDNMRGLTNRVLEATGCKRNAAGRIVADKRARYIAERIARTENSRANNAGRTLQMKEAGAVRKVWRTNPGRCEFCAPLEGKTIGIDKNYFEVGGVATSATGREMRLDYCDTGHPPLHPNCTCVIEYEFEEA